PGRAGQFAPSARRPFSLTAEPASSYPRRSMLNYLEFEKPIAELATRVAELKETATRSDDIDIDAEVGRLEAKSAKLLRDTYAKQQTWQKALAAQQARRQHY